MAKFTKGHAFASDEQMTHTKLNNLVDLAEFASDAVEIRQRHCRPGQLS